MPNVRLPGSCMMVTCQQLWTPNCAVKKLTQMATLSISARTSLNVRIWKQEKHCLNESTKNRKLMPVPAHFTGILITKWLLRLNHKYLIHVLVWVSDLPHFWLKWSVLWVVTTTMSEYTVSKGAFVINWRVLASYYIGTTRPPCHSGSATL